jgi:hypothetical protein
MKIVGGLKAHFEAYRKRTKWHFLWRLSLEGLVVPVVAGILLWLIFHFPPRSDIRSHGAALFIELVIIAPLLETLLLQSVPVMIARSLGLGNSWQFGAALVPFAGLHFLAGAGAGICAGILGGFYIAFTYTRWRQESFRSAFWMTASFHAIHNFAPAIYFLLRGK